ncbi:MAG: hypothetical protein JNJ54_15080 [Myxococcaceae bacterium]|nr:hypothetical protein [Myxococcaceae bacterium]
MPFLLALALTASSPPQPLDQAERIQPVGWSADQKRVALRVFFGAEASEAEDCAGYVDGEGKKFRTGLALVVLNEGAVEHTFVIQRPPMDSCTSVVDAKAELGAAKAKLDELGIDRAAPGRSLAVKRERAKKGSTELFRATDGNRTVLEFSLSVSESDDGVDGRRVTTKGSWKRLPPAGVPTSGTLTLPPTSYSLIMAGSFRYDFTVLASPAGDRLLVFSHERHSNMRGSWNVSRLLDLK